ncbi:uncharacterized protein [Manis javanica]|uniref:uncharacterized protein n=1 Tax=Manis javanica TaxID=9974 RepID=UPI003C6D4E88
MKPSPWRSASRGKHPSPARSGGAAPALRGSPPPPLSSRGPESPQRHIPGDSRSVTRPTRRAAARGSRGGKGAAEGGAAARSGSQRPDTKRPARPVPPVPTRPGVQFPRPGPLVAVGAARANPALPPPPPLLLRKQKQAAGPGRSQGPVRGHSPGVPPERSREPTVGAGAGDTAGGSESAQNERVGDAGPRVRPGVGAAGISHSALEQPVGASPPSGRRAAGRRPMGAPRAGWLHGPPTSQLPGRQALRSPRRRLLLPARRPGSLARSTAHPRHPHPPPEPGERAARSVGAPPVTRLCAARSAAVQRNTIPSLCYMCTERPACARHGARHWEIRDRNRFF